MVEGQAQCQHPPHSYAFARLVHDHRPGHDATDSQTGTLRRIDDWRECVDFEHAKTGDSKVASRRSSGRLRPARAASIRRSVSPAICPTDLAPTSRTTGTIRPCGVSTATPM